MSLKLAFKPLTIKEWNDFVTLFGERGACGGCWCMLWRLTRKQFDSQKGEGNKLAMKAIIDSGEVPGILAYHSNKSIGWCAIAPRSSYPALSRSRILQPIDDRHVGLWPVCLSKSHIERWAHQQSSYGQLLDMPNQREQNWWKVIRWNQNLRKIFLQLLLGPVYPAHLFELGSKRSSGVHQHDRL